MATAELYEADFYAWTQQQARALRGLDRSHWNGPLDLRHLAEEVEDLGKSERDAVRSHLRTVIEHCLKLEHSPTQPPRGNWIVSVTHARVALQDKLTATLRHDALANLDRLYRQARLQAAAGLRAHGEIEAARALPGACPYALDRLLEDDWYPASRHGLVDEA
jgi:hypothetical protein